MDRQGDGFICQHGVYCEEVALRRGSPAKHLDPTDCSSQTGDNHEVGGEAPGRSQDGLILNDPLTFPK
jgi:hypothetical protein